MRRNKTAVIGLGNYLLCDEGLGLHAVEILRRKKYSSDIDFIDAGTPGMNLLHQLDERRKIIFIDAGNCGLKPGEFTRFKPGDAVSLKKDKNYSLHEFDLIGFLKTAKKIGKTGDIDIVIYCMQAAEIKISQELSPKAIKTLPILINEIYNELEGGESYA